MTLLRTTFLNAIAVATKIISLIALNKILAILIGPAGYALMGQLQNVMTMLTAVASAGVGTGVTKYTAEYSAEPERQRVVWRTATYIGVMCSVILAVVVILLHGELSHYVLKSKTYSGIFILVGLCLVMFVFNNLLLAILNGKKAIGIYVLANIANSLLSLLITAVLAWQLGLQGALIALAINQSVSFIITLWLCRRTNWFTFGSLFGPLDYDVLKKLSHFTLMAICTSAVGPACQILIRSHLINDYGIIETGQWEALNRISNLYLMFLVTPLSVYYLPRLSELKDKPALRKEILAGYKLLLPVAILMAVTLLVLKDWIIPLMFTHEFLPLEKLMPWQLVGDVFRVCAWLLSFFLMSRSLTVIFIVAEIGFSISLIGLTILLTAHYGMGGAPLAYALNYIIYVVLVGTIVYGLLSDQSRLKV